MTNFPGGKLFGILAKTGNSLLQKTLFVEIGQVQAISDRITRNTESETYIIDSETKT